MSLFSTPREHAANPPSTWTASKASDRCWHLVTKDGAVLATEPTRRAAVAAARSGFLVDLYDKETRWYMGHLIPGWKPYVLPWTAQQWVDTIAANA